MHTTHFCESSCGHLKFRKNQKKAEILEKSTENFEQKLFFRKQFSGVSEMFVTMKLSPKEKKSNYIIYIYIYCIYMFF